MLEVLLGVAPLLSDTVRLLLRDVEADADAVRLGVAPFDNDTVRVILRELVTLAMDVRDADADRLLVKLFVRERLEVTVFTREDERENVAVRVDVRVADALGDTPTTPLLEIDAVLLPVLLLLGDGDAVTDRETVEPLEGLRVGVDAGIDDDFLR